VFPRYVFLHACPLRHRRMCAVIIYTSKAGPVKAWSNQPAWHFPFLPSRFFFFAIDMGRRNIRSLFPGILHMLPIYNFDTRPILTLTTVTWLLTFPCISKEPRCRESKKPLKASFCRDWSFVFQAFNSPQWGKGQPCFLVPLKVRSAKIAIPDICSIPLRWRFSASISGLLLWNAHYRSILLVQ